MKSLIASILLSLSLVVAPVAHAAGIDCTVAGCESSETEKTSKSEKQDDKSATSVHHCCSTHLSIKSDIPSSEPFLSSVNATFLIVDEVTVSRVVGPPLEPPATV